MKQERGLHHRRLRLGRVSPPWCEKLAPLILTCERCICAVSNRAIARISTRTPMPSAAPIRVESHHAHTFAVCDAWLISPLSQSPNPEQQAAAEDVRLNAHVQGFRSFQVPILARIIGAFTTLLWSLQRKRILEPRIWLWAMCTLSFRYRPKAVSSQAFQGPGRGQGTEG